ncbi:MAG: hypothetical protein QOH39_2896 [Verrucomicrobiota bacterium]|jgi:O-antigen/teichoic acid export membrane protein
MKVDSGPGEPLPGTFGFSGTPRRHMAKGAIGVFLAEGLLVPTGLITAAFLTRKLAPEGYGLFAVAASLIAWIEWSITATFSRAAFKLIGESDDWRPIGTALVRLHLWLGIAGGVLVWIFAGTIAAMLKAPPLAGYLRLFAIDIPIFSLAQAHRGILVGVGAFRPRAMVTAVRWITRLILIIILVQIGFSITGAILGSIGASLVELAACRFYIRPAIFTRVRVPMRQLWDYALPLFLYAASVRLLDKLDLFMLQGLRGNVVEAGMYGAAQNLTLVAGLFALSFSPLLLATLSRMVRNGEIELARRTARDALRVVLAMLPFAAMTSGAATEIALETFGQAFRPTATPLAILIFGSVATVTISVSTAILTAAGRPRLTVVLTAPLVIAAAAGYYLFIPKFGAFGAATVTTAIGTAGAIASVLVLRQVWAVKFPALCLARSAFIGAGAYALAILCPVSGILFLALKLSTIGLLILFAFALLGEFNQTEWATIRAFLRRNSSEKVSLSKE